MSLLKRLLGFGSTGQPDAGAGETLREVEHKGFRIKASPFKDGGQFQTCGVITREVGGTMREHRFIRADRFAALEDAVDVSIRKGRQMIDEQGDKLFDR